MIGNRITPEQRALVLENYGALTEMFASMTFHRVVEVLALEVSARPLTGLPGIVNPDAFVDPKTRESQGVYLVDVSEISSDIYDIRSAFEATLLESYLFNSEEQAKAFVAAATFWTY